MKQLHKSHFIVICVILLCNVFAFGVTLHEIKDGLESYIGPPMGLYKNSFSTQLELQGSTKILFYMDYYIGCVSGDIETSSAWVLEDFILASVSNGIAWVFSHKSSVTASGFTFGGAVISIRYKSYTKTSTAPVYHNRKYKLTASKYNELEQFVDKYDINVWREEAEGLWSRFLISINEEAKSFTSNYKRRYADKLKKQSGLSESKQEDAILTSEEMVEYARQINYAITEYYGANPESIKFYRNDDGSYNIFLDYGDVYHGGGLDENGMQGNCYAVAMVTRKMEQKTKYLIAQCKAASRRTRTKETLRIVWQERWKILTKDCRNAFPEDGNFDYYDVVNILKKYWTYEKIGIDEKFEPIK